MKSLDDLPMETCDRIIRECPHLDVPRWLCEDCLQHNYDAAFECGRLLDLPELEAASEDQLGYAECTRWQAIEKHGEDIRDLVELETEASWWLDNRSGILRGSLTGKLGKLLAMSRLRASDPVEAKRQELSAQLKSAEDLLAKARRDAEIVMEQTLVPYRKEVQHLVGQLDQLGVYNPGPT